MVAVSDFVIVVSKIVSDGTNGDVNVARVVIVGTIPIPAEAAEIGVVVVGRTGARFLKLDLLMLVTNITLF